MVSGSDLDVIYAPENDSSLMDESGNDASGNEENQVQTEEPEADAEEGLLEEIESLLSGVSVPSTDTSELTVMLRAYVEYDMAQTQKQSMCLEAIAVSMLFICAGMVLYMLYRFLKSIF